MIYWRYLGVLMGKMGIGCACFQIWSDLAFDVLHSWIMREQERLSTAGLCFSHLCISDETMSYGEMTALALDEDFITSVHVNRA